MTSPWNQSQLFGSGGADDQDERNRWATPPGLFGVLDKAFGPFALDAAAEASTAKCVHWLGPDNPDPTARDAFTADWSKHITAGAHPSAWLNPPYGDIGRWLRLAEHHHIAGWLVGVLMFARTDTAVWHDVVMERASRVLLLRGRVRFLRPDGTRGDAAPAPSAFVLFTGHGHGGPPVFDSWTPPDEA